MSDLDMRTVLLSFVLSNAICACVMISMWVMNRRRSAGLGLWLANYGIQFVAIALLALRGVVIPTSISIMLGNPLVVAGIILLYQGLQRYTGKVSGQWHNYLLLVALTVVHEYFAFAQPDLLVRTEAFSLVSLALFIQCAWLMLRQVDREMLPRTRLAGIVFVILGLLSLIRLIGDLVMPPQDFLASGPLDVLVIMAYQMLAISLTFSLALMVSRGLLADLHRDIAERERAEEALHQAKAAADQANHSKTEFLARLSHELRTPLTPVLIAIGQWQEQGGLTDAAKDDLAMARRNLELEARLLDDLLDVNRIVYGKLALRREMIDVHQKITDALEIVDADLQGKHLKLKLELHATQSTVNGDAARLLQVIWNPLRNAIKFTPEGGSITVSTRNDAESQISIRISDTGVGIEPDRLPQLFKPFEQAGQKVADQLGGLGLGLAICRSLVEMHRGTITAQSGGAGRGSTFTICLPVVARPVAEKSAQIPRLPSVSGTRSCHVLLVEDHHDTARLLSRVMKSWGNQVRTAHSVAEAIASAENEPFDLLISDLGLPDGSGHDLMRQLSAKRRIRGIAVSGFGMEADHARSREVGFAVHLTKPVNLVELREAIAAAMNGQGAEPASCPATVR